MTALPSPLPELMQAMSAQGLNLHGCIPMSTLPKAWHAAAPQAGSALPSRGGLWVISHRGPALWRHLNRLWGEGWATRSDQNDAIDDWVRAEVSQALDAAGVRHQALFPGGDVALPLQALGESLAWGRASPMQISIHAEWGTWMAYRAVFWLDLPLPLWGQAQAAHPCEHCAHRACEQACPADALRPLWRGEACAQQRLRQASPCANNCLARRACPVGADWAYGDAQMAYHSGQSLRYLRAM